MLTVIFTIFLCYVSYFIYKRYTYRCYVCKHLKAFDGPPPKPVIGNVFDLGFDPVDALQKLKQIQDKYGPITKIFLGPSRIYLMVSDPELVEILLSSPVHLTKGVDYKYLQPWLLNGLLLATGRYWQRRRKIITPAFHFKILDDFIPIFNSRGNILIDLLQKVVGQDIDIFPYITAFALDSICETAMGASVDAQTSPNDPYVQAVKTMCYLYIARKMSPWKSNDFLYSWTNDYKLRTKTLQTLHSFTKSVIEQRRKDLQNTKDDEIQEDEFGRKKRTAFLDLLLKSSGNVLNDDDILEEIETFMFAGHDTTSSAISFALLQLAKHPEIQDKVIDELKEIFESDPLKDPNMQDLNNMKYLECVIKESLRYYPVVPFQSRQLEEELKYKNTIIPKGVTVSIFTYAMHKDPKLFVNPEIFDPERFTPENNMKRSNFSFIPFSAGPRNCIGQKFAMYEIKAVLAKILRNFKLLAADSYAPILSAEVILKSKNGVSIRLEKRSF